jgi:hypothetical protein
MVFQTCGVLRKRLHLKEYKMSTAQYHERCIVCTPFKCKRFRNTPHIWNTIVNLFLKDRALPVEVTSNRNYPR